MKKTLVISAVNFSEGGPLSILIDCLDNLLTHPVAEKYEIIVLVHSKNMFNQKKYANYKFVEFPNSKRSYFYRLNLEYFKFGKLAKEMNVTHWLSLHDMSPFLPSHTTQYVYCHNPSPFKKINFADLKVEPSLFFFTLFYKYIYKINIKSNKYVIVQQNWLRDKFVQLFNLNFNQVVVARPKLSNTNQFIPSPVTNNKITFFYPTLARPFKNIEVIGKAFEYLSKNHPLKNVEMIITIDGTENKYARKIVNQFYNVPCIKFIGKITKDAVFDIYNRSIAMIFPSTLETWGLPLSEFKEFNKPILAANLPYAKETVGSYNKVKFFNPYDYEELAALLQKIINGEEIEFDKTESLTLSEPYANDWNELISLLLK